MGYIDYWCSCPCVGTQEATRESLSVCVWLGHMHADYLIRRGLLHKGSSVGHTIIDTFGAHGKGLWSNRQKE